MPLSEDQKAMLRLLAQSDVSYEDIAALKGKSVEEVKAEVEAALAELDGAQAAQPSPTPPKPEPTPPPEPSPRKEEPAEKPTPAPSASPKTPEKPQKTRPARQSAPVERWRLLALMGGALALVAVVLGAIALISGGGDDSGSSSGSVDTASELAAAQEDDRVTRAVLEPADGSDATGVALFGRLGKDEVVLQVTAEGVDPTTDGESYTVWLYRSPKVALRVGAVKVDEGQDLAARFPIPAELLAYVAGGAFNKINVSRTSDAVYKREVAQAQKQKRLPSYSGDTILSGDIVGPLAEAAKQGR
jgi:hypothetical protein